MVTSIRHAVLDDLSMIAALAAAAQADPNRSCAYLGDDAGSIAADVSDVVGLDGGDWTTATWVAIDEHGLLQAWVLAETDPAMGRVWWWGPILTDTSAEQFVELSNLVYETAVAAVSDFGEHELALDERSVSLVSFAERHGFAPDAASAVLTTAPFGETTSSPDPDIIAIDERHHPSVISLHDQLFPGSHTTGARIVEVDDDHIRLVIQDADGDGVAGYVAAEQQHDGSLYLDYLGVAADRRCEGLGRRLVAEVMRLGAVAGATHAHLTVRTMNVAARQLYRSLGFVEERVLVPYRLGFTLD
ncbi:MAG: N-acetyltransferase [Ilumatobacter sp.]|uniref:GNAT family N-acetyltransferase n=1 Tax=Ilumatobacter sp. TaxID=1967498 RepID=UPI003C788B73